MTRQTLYYCCLIAMGLWTTYCLVDLLYVWSTYYGFTPGLGIVPLLTTPKVEPGFWAEYLGDRGLSWGSVVTGLGVIALLARPPFLVVDEPDREAERQSVVLPLNLQRPEPRFVGPVEEPVLRAAGEQSSVAEREEGVLWTDNRVEPEPRLVEEPQPHRTHPLRSAPILRAIRAGRAAAPAEPAPEPRFAAPHGTEEVDEEFAFFEVVFEDATSVIEPVRRTEFGGDDRLARRLVRERLDAAARAAGKPPMEIRSIRLTTYFGFPRG